MTKLLCLCSAPITPPILQANLPPPPFGNPLPLSYKNLVLPTSSADLESLGLTDVHIIPQG